MIKRGKEKSQNEHDQNVKNYISNLCFKPIKLKIAQFITQRTNGKDSELRTIINESIHASHKTANFADRLKKLMNELKIFILF